MSSQAPQLQPLNVLNLRQHINQRIRDAILDGTYKPGQRLVETFIAEQLDVSRAPVREALSALEQEGVVIHVPRRGYLVVDFTDKDIEEVYSLRLLLEVGALERVVKCATEQDLAEMQCLVDDLGEAAMQKQDANSIVTLDMAFHEFICRVADHSRLYSAWDSLRLQTRLLLGVTSKTHYDHPEQPKKWHQDILDAICDKDAKRAGAILTEHILDAQYRATEALGKLHSSNLE